MVDDTPKVYIIGNKEVIESIYSEDGNLPVVVLDMDTLRDEQDNVRDEIEKWRDDLRNNVRSSGSPYEIDFWAAKELL